MHILFDMYFNSKEQLHAMQFMVWVAVQEVVLIYDNTFVCCYVQNDFQEL